MNIDAAYQRLRAVVLHTPLQICNTLSRRYGANIYLKREDLQKVRSYKLRGAYNMISQLQPEQLRHGVVCASAGNHAQGVAYSCSLLKIKGVIFMPKITPRQKIHQTKMFGEDMISIQLTGDTFDDCALAAKQYAEQHKMTLIPPFDDLRIIEGQATVAVEVFEDLATVDYIFVPIGGGGLISGIGSYVKEHSPNTKIIGAEPEGAASMRAAFDANGPITLPKIDRFVDGAAVKRVGDIAYTISRKVINDICSVNEGKICTSILRLYNEEAIVAEPAGALSIAALDNYADAIKGKNVVCILSGGNNDIDRMQEIKERSMQYEGLKHYFLIHFAQRSGALKDFVNKVLGPNDDIIRFEYMKKNNKESGHALVGVELNSPKDYEALIERMLEYRFEFKTLNNDDGLFSYMV